jgi:hypothetical protein
MNDHAQNALFDLAVNRAARVTALLGMEHLPFWHQKTRFAIRIPLDSIRVALEHRPIGNYHWCGGEQGIWCEGKAVTP